MKINKQYQIDICDRLALRRMLPKHGDKIVDVCGGYGRLTGEYIERYKDAYLFDLSSNLLEQSKNTYGDRIKIVQGSVYEMPFACGEFDALIMVRTALHLTDFIAAVKELNRILKNNGTAIIEIANKRNLHEVIKRLCGCSAMHPFSLEPEGRFKTDFIYYHPRYIEHIFRQNGFKIVKTIAVTGKRTRKNIFGFFFEYLHQYLFGWLKWSLSIYYLLTK